jgi:hypothetical protein
MGAEAAGTGDLTPSFLAIFLAQATFFLGPFLYLWLHKAAQKF